MLIRAAWGMLFGLAFTVCFAASSGPALPNSSPALSEEDPLGAGPSETEPSTTAAEQRRRPLSIKRKGDILMARKMYREAIETYTEATRDASVIYNKMGIAHHELNELDQALDHYERALSFDSSSAAAMNNIGTVYAARNDHKRAIRQYEAALERSPRSAFVYCNLGTAEFARGHRDEAIAAYQRALELNPSVFERRRTADSLFQVRNVAEPLSEDIHEAGRYASDGMEERAHSQIRQAIESAETPKQKKGFFRQLLDIFK